MVTYVFWWWLTVTDGDLRSLRVTDGDLLWLIVTDIWWRWLTWLTVTDGDPVLKIKDRGDHGRRTKDILGGPKSLEIKKLGSSKGWGDQSAEKTKNWRDKKIFNKQMREKKIRTYGVGWICRNLPAFWEDQTDKKSAVGGPKRILRTGDGDWLWLTVTDGDGG